ncbi:MAG: 50S ribosomal protein L40e [Candidatus Woesearchaeota archaeon]|nr:50S ribosomal protein L40e [Candidatus Woesearchaeota archaeon]
MVKFPEANARMFRNVFVCRRCKAKIRTPNTKVIAGKVKCRRCNSKVLRPKRKK